MEDRPIPEGYEIASYPSELDQQLGKFLWETTGEMHFLKKCDGDSSDEKCTCLVCSRNLEFLKEHQS